jgi:3-deoxy-7-phosphoheptulonate synthase
MLHPIDDLRIQSINPLISPALLNHDLPLSEQAIETIEQGRLTAKQILNKKDDKLLVIVGPCSVHDPEAALEYGLKLKKMIEKHRNELCIIMRVYFEKPRTTIGWKGLINDPGLDDSFKGLHLARKLLLDLTSNGIPCATEFLDTIIPQFISDLISWGAIGARTTESQVHRELASGLSMPVGFKNGTDGNIQIAIDAVRAAAYPHHFLGVTKSGIAAIVSTAGNEDCHIILRGSNKGTNYDEKSIAHACEILEKLKLIPALMVDCSHGNSLKDHERQILVAHDIVHQIKNGSPQISGVMLESHLIAGRQDFKPGQALTKGQSITDACLGWSDTVPLLDELAAAVKQRRG